MSSISILHIDDDAIMRMMVKKAIERSPRSMSIFSCATPQEFFDSLSRAPYVVFLIDVQMPLMNGIDVLRKTRSIGFTAPAIFMTGHTDLDITNREAVEPIAGIILKPFPPLTLGEDILRLIRDESHYP